MSRQRYRLWAGQKRGTVGYVAFDKPIAGTFIVLPGERLKFPLCMLCTAVNSDKKTVSIEYCLDVSRKSKRQIEALIKGWGV